MENNYENQYLRLVRYIMDNGVQSVDRTGVGTIKVFSHKIRVDASEWVLPALKCRRVPPRIAFEELMWMLRGSTDVSELKEKNIHIWDGNSSREYLDSYGKYHIPENTIGKGYGHQFRNFNGVDQLAEVVNSLTTNPHGRRHMINLWNPADFNDMALPPCHYVYNFVVVGDRLNLKQNLRSNDVGLGTSVNIMFATFFLGIMAKLVGLKMGEVVLDADDAHIYTNHIDALNTVFDEIDNNPDKWNRICRNDATWSINKEYNTLEEMLSLSWDDISIDGYEYLTTIGRKEMPMAV